MINSLFFILSFFFSLTTQAQFKLESHLASPKCLLEKAVRIHADRVVGMCARHYGDFDSQIELQVWNTRARTLTPVTVTPERGLLHLGIDLLWDESTRHLHMLYGINDRGKMSTVYHVLTVDPTSDTLHAQLAARYDLFTQDEFSGDALYLTRQKEVLLFGGRRTPSGAEFVVQKWDTQSRWIGQLTLSGEDQINRKNPSVLEDERGTLYIPGGQGLARVASPTGKPLRLLQHITIPFLNGLSWTQGAPSKIIASSSQKSWQIDARSLALEQELPRSFGFAKTPQGPTFSTDLFEDSQHTLHTRVSAFPSLGEKAVPSWSTDLRFGNSDIQRSWATDLRDQLIIGISAMTSIWPFGLLREDIILVNLNPLDGKIRDVFKIKSAYGPIWMESSDERTLLLSMDGDAFVVRH